MAAGGPWWSSCVGEVGGDRGRLHQPSPPSLTTCSTGFPVELRTRPIRSAAQPARARLGEGGDHDVVRRVELERVLDRGVGVGVHHLADRLEAGALELAQRVRQALVGVARPAVVLALLRADHDEAARPVLGLLLEVLDQLAAAHGLVGHHERALHVVALGVEVHHHVLDRPPCGALHAVHEPLAQPARARLGMGGDDDLVVVLLAQRVHDRGVGIGVHQLAARLDARLAQQRERHLEPVLGGVAHVVVVDHVAVLGLVLRADHVHVDLLALGAALDRVDQRLARHRLVGHYEDALHGSVGGGAPPPPAGAGAAAPAAAFSLNTACTAPGTPYS